MSFPPKDERISQNAIEYKGIFYNDNPSHQFHEAGAHFKYSDLVQRLQHLEKIKSKNTNKFGISNKSNCIQEEEDPEEALLKEAQSRNVKLHIKIPSFRPAYQKIKELSLPKMYINNSCSNNYTNKRKVKKIIVTHNKKTDTVSLSKEKSCSIANYNNFNMISNKHLSNSSSLAYIFDKKSLVANNHYNAIPLHFRDMRPVNQYPSRNHLNKNGIQRSIAGNDYINNDKERKTMKNTILCKENRSKGTHIYLHQQIQQLYQHNLKFPSSTTNRLIVKCGINNSRNKQLNIGLKKSSSGSLFEHKTAYPTYRGIHNTSGLLSKVNK